ncbi:MAG: thiamine diphosphokinase, partial [Hungatella sp.]
MTGLIITGGSIDCAFAGAFLKDKIIAMVIAVDGGLAAVKQLDIRPDAIVGDFDTVKGELLEEYSQIEGITFEQHQPEKDETDTELALRTAMEAGVSDMVI